MCRLRSLYASILTVSSPPLAAFSLSSGTIGAALSAALCRKRAIALSYGTFLYPTPTTIHDPAHRLACAILSRLWNNWGSDPGGIRDGEVDLYNVNIPMVEKLLSSDGLRVTWSTMWRSSYGRLFQPQLGGTSDHENPDVPAAGPDLLNADSPGNANVTLEPPPASARLVFKFSPDLHALVNPHIDSLPEGTDAWAVHSDMATVTPLRASFAEPPAESSMALSGETVGQGTGVRYWMKL